MKIGIMAFMTVDAIHPSELARKCEALGFDLLVFPEHPVIPSKPRTPFPRGDGRIPEFYLNCPDPFVTVAMAAAATTKLRVGTGILLVPEHNPINVAKAVATLDHYCNGRFVMGIGGGWMVDELEVFGVDFRRRWPLVREYVRAMKELWTKEDASFGGEFIKFPPIRCNPKPFQKPHPPILVGAAGDRALKNVVAIGDGWMPIEQPPDSLKAQLGKLRTMCGEAGRRFEELDISVTFMDAIKPNSRDLIERYREAGAHRLILNSSPLSRDNADRELEAMARAWIA
ncbi:MAG: LLM class F420-dependent oxidoreductase [Candidatus Binataceae bacterium]|nr:LLM class F420-dependent oxidoreductase [Candidatus Binataceae bacterium]